MQNKIRTFIVQSNFNKIECELKLGTDKTNIRRRKPSVNQRGSAEDVQSEISTRVSEHEGNTTVQSEGLHKQRRDGRRIVQGKW